MESILREIVLAIEVMTASPAKPVVPPNAEPNLITSPTAAAPVCPKVVPVPVTVLLP